MKQLWLVALVACSSNKRSPAIEDAKSARDAAAAADAQAAQDAGSAPKPAGKTGDVQVRVEWRDVPVAARASPGKTACSTPRTPSVAPTTTWGIPDAFVILGAAPTALAPAARVVLADCTFLPRASVAATGIVSSGIDRPTTLTFTKRGTVANLPALDDKPGARTIMLPIAGHAVAPTVDAGGIYELAFGANESAWLVTGSALVTDVSGVVLIKDVPVGKHAVSAWLPPRGGQAARYGKGEVTVEPGDLAELVLQLE